MGQPTLDHEQFPLRLYALARAGQSELREWQPRWNELPLWPLVWSLRRCGWTDTTRGPAGLARLWQRWGSHHRAALKHSRHQCCTGLVNALTWEARLTWLLLLLEGHRERAIDPLLELLRQGDEEIRQLVALGLAQLGRQILPDLRERWRSAGNREKQAICQVLWYLGPQARGCLDWLQGFEHPWARAVFYAMEEHGWQALLALEDAPVWLNDSSLERVASLVFSINFDDRIRALAALRGWGPAQREARLLLEVLVGDPVAILAHEALQLLLEQDGPVGEATLQYALLRAGGKTRSLALKRLFGVEPENMSFAQQRGLLRTLELWGEDWADRLLSHLDLHGFPDPESARRLLPLRNEAAVRAYLRLEGDPVELYNLARDGTIESARALFQHWWHEKDWFGVSACLSRAEFLQTFLSQDMIGQILQRRDFDEVERLVSVLRRMRESGVEPMAECAAQALQSLEMIEMDWVEWNRLSPDLQERHLRVMEWTRSVPDGLVQAVRKGLSPGRYFLELLVEYRPEAQEGLLEGLPLCHSLASSEFLDFLRRFGFTAWRALYQLKGVEGLDRELAYQVHQSEAQEYLLEQAPETARPFSKMVRMAISESLLNSKAPADSRRRSWALELLEYPESATCALYYLLRCYQEVGRQRLLQLFDHENPRMRYQALAAARSTLPDWPRLLRRRPNDPDPQIRAQIFEWLIAKGDLTEEETVE